jgi:hypothetical protein
MTNKAVSRVVIQVALVFGLVLAANAIRPFSPSNVALHTLASARSFSFLLPDGAVERIEQANYLAQTFSRGLFEQNDNNPIWTGEDLLKAGFLASNASAKSLDDAEIKDIKPGEATRKQSPAKRSTRRVRQDNRNNHDDVSALDSNSNEAGRLLESLPVAPAMDSVAMAQPVVRLPVFKPMPAKANLTPASVMFSLPTLPAKLNSCKTIEVKEVKLIALIQQSQRSSKLKVDMLATQPAKISLQCREEEKAVTEEAESALETTTIGPEEVVFFDQRATGPFFAAPVPERIKLP